MSTLYKSLMLTVALVAVALVCANAAVATTILPTNNSFEVPQVATVTAYKTLGDWFTQGVQAIPPAVSDLSVHLRPKAWYNGLVGVDGNQWICIFAAKKVNESYLYDTQVREWVQNLPVSVTDSTIVANMQYQLTAALTDDSIRAPSYNMKELNATMYLEAWSGTVATTIASYAVAGTVLDASAQNFADFSTVLTTPDVSLIGQQLRVRFNLTVPKTFSGANAAYDVDNVRITSSPIPEPGTLALLAAGLAGLLCYAWRKRR